MKTLLLATAIIIATAAFSGCSYNEAFQALDSAARAYYTPRPTPSPVF